MESEILLGRYRHYKGGEYDLLAHATHTETGEALVLYRACGDNGRAWVRPLSMFAETVMWEGASVPRFTLLAAHNAIASAAARAEAAEARVAELEAQVGQLREQQARHKKELNLQHRAYTRLKSTYHKRGSVYAAAMQEHRRRAKDASAYHAHVVRHLRNKLAATAPTEVAREEADRG